MTESTCAALTAVFPIVFLTVTLYRRDINIKMHRHPVVQRIGLSRMVIAVFGLGFTVIDVQPHGLTGLSAFIAWVQTGTAIAGLAAILLALIATFEVEEDESPGQ